MKTVYFKVRGDSESTPMSDTITLDLGGDGDGDGETPPDVVTGFLITEYIVFGAIFGAFAVIEVVIPKLKKRREVPTRLKAVDKTPDKR